MKNSELCVPLAAVSEAMEGEGGSVAPEMGDEVELTVKGTVTRSEGGNLYIQPTEANGQPLPTDHPEQSLDEEGESLERELAAAEGMGGGGGGSYGLMVSLILALFGFEATAADVEFAKDRYSIQSVSNNLAYTTPRQVFSIEIGPHFVGSNLYLMIFDTNSNAGAGAVPNFSPILITNNVTVGKDWGPAGAPFRYGVNAALSTTPVTLTNASGGANLTVISSPAK